MSSEETSVYRIKDGDTPTIAETFLDENGDPKPQPATGAVTLVVFEISPNPDAVIAGSPFTAAYETDGSDGQVTYTMLTTTTALPADFEGERVLGFEYRVTDTNYQDTCPSRGEGRIYIRPAGDT